jgi:hypothetical protein
MLFDYLENLRAFTPYTIDFKDEIHIIFYLYHNNHVNLENNYRVLSRQYGRIFNKEAEDIWHLTPIYRQSLYVIHSSFIKCTITRAQSDDINKKRISLIHEIIAYKIIKDMRKTTSFIINIKLNEIKINQTVNWI